MEDAINWDALFPGMKKEPSARLSYASLLGIYRSVVAVLRTDGATDEEARDLALMLIKPSVEHAIYGVIEGGGS